MLPYMAYIRILWDLVCYVCSTSGSVQITNWKITIFLKANRLYGLVSIDSSIMEAGVS